MVHQEFVPQGQTVNQHFYKGVLTNFVNKIRQKQRAFCAGKNLDLASRQCFCPHSPQSETVLGLERNHHFALSIVFAGLSPLRFLSFSKTERDFQGDMLPSSRGYQDQHDKTLQNHHKRRIFTVLQSVVEKNGKVHQSQWGIF